MACLQAYSYLDKNGFVWSFRFFKVKDGFYQTKSRLGHMKEHYSYFGSLETIFEHIFEG